MTNSVLEAVRAALATPSDAIAKSFTQSGSATSGLTYYDLEAPAKTLYPVLTPLRNRIPRVVGGRGIQANWRAITGINTTGVPLGVSEGQRNAAQTHTTADYYAFFRFLGNEDYVTFESDYAAEGFDDVKARAVEGLLRSTMIGEEFMDLSGHSSWGLGQTGTPSLTDVATGGTLAFNTAYKVYCVGLTAAAYRSLAGWNNGVTGQSLSLATAALTPTSTRTNMDGTTDTINGGFAKPSAVASVTTANDSNNTHSIKATVAVQNGAVAYAWYWGTVGNELLGAVTTINSVLITATATGTQNISALGTTDVSQDTLGYDGYFAQIFKSGSGAYVQNLATGVAGTGTKLTSGGGATINELDAAFVQFWNQYRLSPDTIYCNAQQLLDMNALVIDNGGAPLYRFNLDGANPAAAISAGTVIGSYLNKITQQLVKIQVHPNCPPGTMMFYSETVPYPVNNVGVLTRKLLRRDYYQIEWPIRTRRYEYGVYFDGVLQNYFPPAFGIINNIAPGH